MRKIIFTFMLAIVSSVWMTNEAGNWCMPSVRTLTEPWIEVSGTFQAEGFPCEPGEECPSCLTIVLDTNDKIYYLVTDDGQLIDQLDTIPLGTKATVSGIPFEHGSYDYIQVSHIETDQTSQLPSLCDEWNVWHESFESFGPISFDKVVKYQLTTDTLINGQQYVKLTSDKDSPYLGAMREGNNRDIYYVPADSTNEFLLYAFNAQVGEVLNDLYLGGFEENGYSGRVEAISDGSPRLFTIRVLYPTGMGVEPEESFSVTWIEGVGSPETPYGLAVVPTVPADIGVYTLLCAYKNGEQVYTSTMGEQYGCEFNGIPSTKPYHLCDEWNIAKISNAFGPVETQTVKAFLGSDTIIESQNYVKLIEDSKYKGAMREGESGVIYYIPAGSAHEYLLYNFNAQVGDRLTNLWYGGAPEWCPNGYNATVLSISNETPRVFTIEVEYIITDSNGEHIIPWTIDWTEGIGLSDGPAGQFCPGPECACSCGQVLLCAYKNGEHIYTSDLGEQYGCVYNRHTFNYLCDEWNVLHEPFSWPGGYNTFKYYLSTDTIINGKQYVKLASDKDYPYCGAFREDINANIYYIPSGSTHEYLLYAFNAQTGDTLSNLWVGGFGEDYQGVVQAISKGSPRIFTIGVMFYENSEYDYPIQWIEGVGSPETPMGLAVVPTVPADIGVFNLLCAYKNGQQVYTSTMGEQYNCGEDASDAMFPPETRWNYEHTKMYGGPDDNYFFTLQPMDTIISNTRYQQIGSFLFRSKGAKVWCAVDSMGTFVERLVYDFDLQVGDSIRAIYYGYDREAAGTDLPQYAKVTSVEYITLSDGRSARRISYDGFRPDDIEHIGSIEGILTPLNLPVAECGCSDLFQCCTKSDYLLYEVAQGACDTFLLKEQPSDTIPLFSYTGDDPGSSTVDPVDPNQVVVTLKDDVLTVKETSGEEITLELSLTYNRNHMPALKRIPETETFRNEVTITLNEEGTYTLELTNPSWGYTIYGTFNYPQRKDAIDQNIVPQPAAEKIIRNEQLLIRKGDKVYTVQGTAINE